MHWLHLVFIKQFQGYDRNLVKGMVPVMIGEARRHTVILTYTCSQFEHHKLKLIEAIRSLYHDHKIKETFGCWLFIVANCYSIYSIFH